MSDYNSTTSAPALLRRVITGHGESGQSTVIFDDAQGQLMTVPNGNRFQTVWVTNEVPADLSSNVDSTRGLKSFPGADGSVCIILYMKPGTTSPTHRTKTIDYAVVLEGEIELVLEKGEKRVLKTGDVLVQRGTVHAFHNPPSNTWAKVFCVMIASTA